MEESKVTLETMAMEVIKQAKRQIKFFFIAWIITLVAFVSTNAAWIYVFQSYKYISQDGDGINSINSGYQGDLYNEPESEN